MGKLFVSYKIENVIDGIVKPGDELKGKVFIRSEEKKDQKLKGIGAMLAAHYNEDVWKEDFHTKDWALVTRNGSIHLKNYEIVKANTKIAPGETKEFDFIIKLSSIPGPQKWGWYVSLSFFAKSGLFSSGATDADEASCVLPVPGSTRMPSFGDIPGGLAVDPPRNPPPRPTSPTRSQREGGHQASFQASSGPSFAPAPPSGPSRHSLGGSHGGGGR